MVEGRRGADSGSRRLADCRRRERRGKSRQEKDRASVSGCKGPRVWAEMLYGCEGQDLRLGFLFRARARDFLAGGCGLRGG